MNIYLAGAILGCSDKECVDWRTEAKKLLKDRWCSSKSLHLLDPMCRDYRGQYDKDIRNEIVMLDKMMIDRSNILIANTNVTSWGTGMEILYAWERGKIVVCFSEKEHPIWVRYHSASCHENLEKAVKWIYESIFIYEN